MDQMWRVRKRVEGSVRVSHLRTQNNSGCPGCSLERVKLPNQPDATKCNDKERGGCFEEIFLHDSVNLLGNISLSFVLILSSDLRQEGLCLRSRWPLRPSLKIYPMKENSTCLFFCNHLLLYIIFCDMQDQNLKAAQKAKTWIHQK